MQWEGDMGDGFHYHFPTFWCCEVEAVFNIARKEDVAWIFSLKVDNENRGR